MCDESRLGKGKCYEGREAYASYISPPPPLQICVWQPESSKQVTPMCLFVWEIDCSNPHPVNDENETRTISLVSCRKQTFGMGGNSQLVLKSQRMRNCGGGERKRGRREEDTR